MFYQFKITSVFLVIAVTSLCTAVNAVNPVVVFPKYPAELLDGKLVQIDQKLAECEGINILEISIPKLEILFKDRNLTSLQLTKCYLERIRRMDPYLHAVIEFNPDAEEIAKELDLERRDGKVRGPLHGIPILIKDNIATTDDMQTTAGSLALLGLKPRDEATVVKKLRMAGAVILGKTNLSEFANFRGTNIPGGWSSRGNQTFNPYVFSATPSGSSTGSAVAIATNMAVAALGTETDGSIISPCHRASLVGLKTTVGVLPTKGVIPISSTQDTVGVIARSVIDATLVLNEIADREYHIQANHKKIYRIGVLRDPFWKNTTQNAKLEDALLRLGSSNTITLIDPVQAAPGLIDSITWDAERVVLLHEFKDGINKYLSEVSKEPHSLTSAVGRSQERRISTLADIIVFNKEHPAPEGYNQDNLIGSEETDGLKNETYVMKLNDNKLAARAVFAATLDRYNLNAIVTPTEQPWTNASLLLSDHSFSVAAIAGYPSITVPAGFTSDNLPFGITFMGRANSENILINIGSIMESKLQARRRPKFIP